MTEKFLPESSLKKKASAPGGKTAADAIRAANANLEKIKDDILGDLDNKLVRIKGLAISYTDISQESVRAEIYDLSNSLIGMASVAGFPELGEAAYCLCDLLQQFVSKGKVNRDFLTVYVNGMWLLRHETFAKDKQRTQVIDGLRQIVGRW